MASAAWSPILANLRKHILLNDQEEAHFLSLLREHHIPRKEFLLKENEPCPIFSYVLDGVLRAYYKDADDNETIMMFAINDWWITDMHAFAHEKPSIVNIQAVEETTVLQLQKKDMEALYLKLPQFERFFRIIIQNAYIREQLRTIENLSVPAKDRYNNFLLKYPEFARRIPLKQIASYLGITPEFLSVIRKNAAHP